MPEFVHLHNHSTFSFFDGAAKIDDLVAKTKAMGMTALALTDHGNVHGLPEFQQEAESAGVKPILGVEGYLVEDYDAYLAIANKKSGDRTAAEKKQLKTRYHQIVLAKNETGLDNLHRLISWAHTEGKQYGRYPLFDFKRLKQYREGLIVTSSCMQGIISQAIIAGDIERAEQITRWFLDTFGEDFYFEAHNHGLDEEAKVRAGIKKLQKTTGAQVICCNDVHYVEPEDYELQKLKVALSTRKNVFEAGDYAHEGVHMKTPAEMADLFHERIPRRHRKHRRPGREDRRPAADGARLRAARGRPAGRLRAKRLRPEVQRQGRAGLRPQSLPGQAAGALPRSGGA